MHRLKPIHCIIWNGTHLKISGHLQRRRPPVALERLCTDRQATAAQATAAQTAITHSGPNQLLGYTLCCTHLCTTSICADYSFSTSKHNFTQTHFQLHLSFGSFLEIERSWANSSTRIIIVFGSAKVPEPLIGPLVLGLTKYLQKVLVDKDQSPTVGITGIQTTIWASELLIFTLHSLCNSAPSRSRSIKTKMQHSERSFPFAERTTLPPDSSVRNPPLNSYVYLKSLLWAIH